MGVCCVVVAVVVIALVVVGERVGALVVVDVNTKLVSELESKSASTEASHFDHSLLCWRF